MDTPHITREQILNALSQALEPLDYTHAMWEGGAVAFNRLDEWSDIDLIVDVDDEHVGDTFTVIERTLETLSPVELKYEIPQPAWHGMAQTFYRLQNASKYHLVDIAVTPHSNPNKFLEKEIHGEVVVYFDKSGVVHPDPLNREKLEDQLHARLEALRVTFDLFQIMTQKELNRGNDIEAISFYFSYTLRPLVEVLRIKHQPARHGFFTHYVYYDLPEEVVKKLEGLFFVKDAEDLRAKHAEAQAWFDQLVKELEMGALQ